MAGSETRVPASLGQRLVTAIPHLAAGAFLTVVFVEYVSGDIRLTARIHSVSAWLFYELMACAYATVLPLGLIVVGVVRAARGLPPKVTRRDGSLLLLLPFAYFAWSIPAPGPGRWWALGAFLGLALPRWLPHRRQSTMLRDGVVLLVQTAGRAVRIWAFFTAAFLLSAFLILPLEPLLGLDMPSVDHGQHFLLLGIGIVYFALNVVFTLFDLENRLFPAKRKLKSLLRRDLDEMESDKTAA